MHLQVSKDGTFWQWVAYLPADPDMAEVRVLVGPWEYWRLLPRNEANDGKEGDRG
jgi:hypothetical protein